MKGILDEKGWQRVNIGTRNRGPTIALSSGKNKYIRFSSSFIKINGLQDKKHVEVFIKKDGNKKMMAFSFSDKKEEGTLKMSLNPRTGTGYISGSHIYHDLEFIPRNKEKLIFIPKKEVIDGMTYFIIEIKN